MSEAIVSVFSDHVCRLGEGPSYDPATDTLYWFDIVNSQLLEKRLSGGATTVHELGQM
ncbi:MAG: SMP-30/gluconolactonase/LRE family protein, partial [Mesorhizobium sp.]